VQQISRAVPTVPIAAHIFANQNFKVIAAE
jgi:hypothetical protein